MTPGRHSRPGWRRSLRTGWYAMRADLDDLKAAYRQSLRQRDPAPLLACRDLMLRARPGKAASPDRTVPAPAAGTVLLQPPAHPEGWWME